MELSMSMIMYNTIQQDILHLDTFFSLCIAACAFPLKKEFVSMVNAVKLINTVVVQNPPWGPGTRPSPAKHTGTYQ